MSHATIIYPDWPKLPEQVHYPLPPHGPVCMAATVPDDCELTLIDDNVDPIDEVPDTDLVLLSMMLTCQLPRGFEIARRFRERNIPVIAGGIATMLHAEEVARHVDSVFLGEAEDGRFARLYGDWKEGRLEPVYDFHSDLPPIESVGPARRDLLNYERYKFNRVRLVDLVHASRGCQHNCPPCPTIFLGGTSFRPRPIDRVVKEIEGIDNSRLFIVDNTLAHDKTWLLDLFAALKPLNRHWVSHPILDDDEVLAAAADAGAWFVYHTVYEPSEMIGNRIKRMKDHGIGVQAAVMLGTENQDADTPKEIVDFILEADVDMAEFSIMTPFPHSAITDQLEKEGRILHKDWKRYNTAEVCFKPKRMSPEKLQEMYHYAWEAFYRDESQMDRMGRLIQQVIMKEGRLHMRGVDPKAAR